MKKNDKPKSKFEEIEQRIFAAKTEEEKEIWRKVLKKMKLDPPKKLER